MAVPKSHSALNGLPRHTVAACLLLALCGVFAVGQDEKAPSPNAAASAGTVEVSAFTAPSTELEIASDMGGIVAKVDVEEGDRVTPGQTLVELKADVLRAQLAVSRAKLDAAKVQIAAHETTYQTRKAEYDRSTKLFNQKVISSEEHEKAKLEMDLAKHNWEYAIAQLKVAELLVAQDEEALKQMTVSAPTSGVILRITKRAGEAVEEHGPLLKMVSTDPLHVIAYLPIRTAGKVKVGAKADFFPENMPEQCFACTAAVVDNVADAASGTYRVKLILPNAEGAVTAGCKGKVSLKL